jgi:putative tryptophan/tyrosine transport system substrate-binding protein
MIQILKERQMFRRFVLNFVLLALVLVSFSHAQDDDVPVVAMIKLGPISAFELAQQGVRDIFEHYGYTDGENVTYWYGNAEFDIEIAHALVEQAIAADADILITITTPVTLAALEITATMENPPIVLFGLVTDPYASGIAESPCIKASHVSGSQLSEPYADVFSLIPEFDPSIQTVGYLYNDEEANSVVATEIVTAVADELGIDLAVGVVHSPEEVAPVAETLAVGGVDAFFIGADSTVASNLENLLELADVLDVPVFAVTNSQVNVGATIGIGASTYFGGVDLGLMAVGYLNGTVDIATTAISRQEGFSLGINYDAAALQNVTIPESLIERSDFQVQNGENNQTEPSLDEFSDEQIETMNQEFMDAQACTEERIAEEQAALDSEE